MTRFQELKNRYKSGEICKAEYIAESLSCHAQLNEYVQNIRNTDIQSINITRSGVEFTIGELGINLFVPPEEARVAPLEILNFDQYEPAETEVMDVLSASCNTILDIGANIGWYSVRFALRQPEAEVYAFEPLPTTYRYLQRNIAANNVAKQVMTFNMGLSERAATVDFYIAPANGTNASLKNVAADSAAVAVKGVVLTLDEWVSNYQVMPEFIKCDVEGAEYLVFKGGVQTLKKYKPVIFTELLRKWSKPFNYHPNDLIQFLDNIDYACFAICDSGVKLLTEVTDETAETNYAFLHRKVHKEKIAQLEALK